MEIVFPPPNTTSELQPFDAGTIASMKVRYGIIKMKRELYLEETKYVLEIYKVDILSIMIAFNSIWNALSSS